MRKKALGLIAGLLSTTVAFAQLPQFVFTIDSNNTAEYLTTGGLLVDGSGNTAVVFYHRPSGAIQQVPAIVKWDMLTNQVIFSDTINNLPYYIIKEIEKVGNSFWLANLYDIQGFGSSGDIYVFNVDISGTAFSSNLFKAYGLQPPYYFDLLSNYSIRIAENPVNQYILLTASVSDGWDSYAYFAQLDYQGNVVSDTLINLSGGNGYNVAYSINDFIWVNGDTFLLTGEIGLFGSYTNYFVKRVIYDPSVQQFIDIDFTTNVFNYRSSTSTISFKKIFRVSTPERFAIIADSVSYPYVFFFPVNNINPQLIGVELDIRDQNNGRIKRQIGEYFIVSDSFNNTYYLAFVGGTSFSTSNVVVIAFDPVTLNVKWAYGYETDPINGDFLFDLKLVGDKLVVLTSRWDNNGSDNEVQLFSIDTADGSLLTCQAWITVPDTFTVTFVPRTINHVAPDFVSQSTPVTTQTQDYVLATAGTHYFEFIDQSYTLTWSISKTDPSNCSASDGSITFSASGGIAPYTYYDTANNVITSPWNNLPAGTYTIIAVDANGCQASTSITLAPANQPSVSNTTIINASCPGSSDGSINITVQNCGACQFTWIDNNTGDTVGTSQNLSNVPAGDYVVIIVDGNCSVTAGPYTVNEPAPITIIGSVTNVSSCGASDGSINISVSGGTPGYTYSWTGPGGFSSSSQNISNLAAGTYIVTVSDANGCTAQDTFVVGTPTPPSIDTSQTTITDVSCNGGSDGAINITVQNCTNCQFSWTGPGGFSANTEDISGLSAGQYIITITDGNTSCSYTDTFIVNEPPAIIINGTVTDVSCNGGSDGSIDITVGGGVGNFTFSWSNGATTEDITGVPAGSYTVTVTDANGCTATASFTVNEPPALSISLSFDSNTNVISASVSGGTPPYSYSWNTGSTDDSIVVSTSGQYFVTVTDANGCSISDTITVQVTSGIVSIESAGCKLLNEGEKVRLTCSRTPASAILYDLIGRQIPLEIRGNEIIIDHTEGIYILKVIWFNGDISIVKLLGR